MMKTINIYIERNFWKKIHWISLSETQIFVLAPNKIKSPLLSFVSFYNSPILTVVLRYTNAHIYNIVYTYTDTLAQCTYIYILCVHIIRTTSLHTRESFRHNRVYMHSVERRVVQKRRKSLLFKVSVIIPSYFIHAHWEKYTKIHTQTRHIDTIIYRTQKCHSTGVQD